MTYRWIVPFIVLASCNIYNSNFDCPPGEGIGCAPVGEVLDLIVERDTGEDLFVEDRGTALLLKQEGEQIRPIRRTRKKLVLIQDESGNFLLVDTQKENS